MKPEKMRAITTEYSYVEDGNGVHMRSLCACTMISSAIYRYGLELLVAIS